MEMNGAHTNDILANRPQQGTRKIVFDCNGEQNDVSYDVKTDHVVIDIIPCFERAERSTERDFHRPHCGSVWLVVKTVY